MFIYLLKWLDPKIIPFFRETNGLGPHAQQSLYVVYSRMGRCICTNIPTTPPPQSYTPLVLSVEPSIWSRSRLPCERGLLKLFVVNQPSKWLPLLFQWLKGSCWTQKIVPVSQSFQLLKVFHVLERLYIHQLIATHDKCRAWNSDSDVNSSGLDLAGAVAFQ